MARRKERELGLIRIKRKKVAVSYSFWDVIVYQSLCAFKYIFYVSVKMFFTKQRFLFSGIHLKLLKWCYQLVWKKKRIVCVCGCSLNRDKYPSKMQSFGPRGSTVSCLQWAPLLVWNLEHIWAPHRPLCGPPTLSRAPQWSRVHTLGAGLWWGKLCVCVLAFRPHVNSVLDHWKKNPPSNSFLCLQRFHFATSKVCSSSKHQTLPLYCL